MTTAALMKAVVAIGNILATLDEDERRRVLKAVLALEETTQGLPPHSERRAGRPHGINGGAAFSDDQVRELRKAKREGKLKVSELVRETGLTRASVYLMLNGTTYKHVTEE